MSGEGANAPEVQDQLYGTNSNSIQQELRMDEGSVNGISTSAVEMADFEVDDVLSNILNPDDYLAKRLLSINEIDSEETLDVDNIQHDQQGIPPATSELTLPPFPGELEKSAQASNPGFNNLSQNIEVFSQNVEVLCNASQNVEVFREASQNAELFQNIVSQNNALPLQGQFDQFGNLNIGQNYGGSFSAAPLATQGTAVTGFSGGNFQMPTSNLTSQNSESSSSVQLAPIQQPYPQMKMSQPAHIQQSTQLQQGLQEIHRSQRPHEMGAISLRNLKKRLRGLHPTENSHQTRASPLRNVMMKMTHPISNKQSFNLQHGFRGIHPTRNPNGYASLRNVMQGLQRISPAQSQHEIGQSSLRNVTQGPQGISLTQKSYEMRPSSLSNAMPSNNQTSAGLQTRMQVIPSTQNPHEMGSSSLSNVMHSAELQQGLQGNYPTQNWHEAGSYSSSNTTQGLQGIYPTQNQNETGSYSSSDVMSLQQGLQGIYLTQDQHETGLSSSSNIMQGFQGIYPTQNQHVMGSSSASYAMQGQLAIYPSQNPHELGASSQSNVMMRIDLSGNNQQPVVSQVGSSLYPVTAQGNYAPLDSPRSNEPLVYDPKFEQLGYPVDPYLRMFQFKGLKKP